MMMHVVWHGVARRVCCRTVTVSLQQWGQFRVCRFQDVLAYVLPLSSLISCDLSQSRSRTSSRSLSRAAGSVGRGVCVCVCVCAYTCIYTYIHIYNIDILY